MKLTENDKALLRRWGEEDKYFPQIEEATRRTTYELDGKRISANEAIAALGREEYLSGIHRSAFHYTAVRKTRDGRLVYFDSSILFKDAAGGDRQ